MQTISLNKDTVYQNVKKISKFPKFFEACYVICLNQDLIKLQTAETSKLNIYPKRVDNQNWYYF
jgi:phenolic acid decarboxylase